MTIAAGYGNVSDIEVMFVVISLIGLAFSLYNAIRAWGDIAWLRENKVKNGRWYLAKMWFVSEAGRAYLQFFFALIGIRAFFYPDPPPRLSTHEAVMDVVLRWGLLVGTAIVTGKTIYIWYIRDRLIDDTNGVHLTDRAEGLDKND